jgi:DNA helicase-2/ATP-dependent DNA helicase PcrA
MQLRLDAKTKIENGHAVMNFGKSKGLTFDRVLIYLPGTMLKWLKDANTDLAGGSRAKLYVAITRARLSVAFVCDDDIGDSFTIWTSSAD